MTRDDWTLTDRCRSSPTSADSGARRSRGLRVLLPIGLGVLLAGPALAAEFRFTPEGLSIRGPIRAGDYQRLRAVIAREGLDRFASQPVLLDSPGGNAIEAEGMARLIELNRSIVRVGDGRQCLSACLLLFAAGSERWLAPRARMGVHRFYMEGHETDAAAHPEVLPAIVADIEASLIRAGIPAPLMQKLRDTPPVALFRFDLAWLRKQGLEQALFRRPELAQAVRSRCTGAPEASAAQAMDAAVPDTCADEVRSSLRAEDADRLRRLVAAR